MDLEALQAGLLDFEEHLAATGRLTVDNADAVAILAELVDYEISAPRPAAPATAVQNDLFANMNLNVGADGLHDPFGLA